MIARTPAHPVDPATAIDHLTDRHGAAAVLWSAIRALLRPRPPDPYTLSAHMRRDIGLLPERPHVPPYFELR